MRQPHHGHRHHPLGRDPARPLCAYPTYVTWNEGSQSWGCEE
ncbi:hypothetical protein [Oceanicola sp. 502str15]|nr:hypothetical protein [Oceanicola sp. 502str15]